MDVTLVTARPDDLERLLPLVRAFHASEGLPIDEGRRRSAFGALLRADGPGRVWLIRNEGRLVGYIAICFGFSIEFGGRDAFIDEVFVTEAERGRGVGRAALDLVTQEARALGLWALHMEVAHSNHAARRLYASRGFEAREHYFLMSIRFDAGREDGPSD